MISAGRVIEDWAAGATIDGQTIPALPDLARMRAQRFARLQDQLDARGSTVWFCSARARSPMPPVPRCPPKTAITPRCFARWRLWSRVAQRRTCTPYPDGAPAELAGDHLHGPLFPDLDEGMERFAAELAELFAAGARIGIDHQTHAMRRGLPEFDWVDAAEVLGAAKIIKTPDEVACIRHAQLLNELAMVEARNVLRPGVRQIDLSAVFYGGSSRWVHRRVASIRSGR